MKKLYINCGSGLSGDMMLGAFINMGVPADHLKEKLARLRLDEFELSIEEKMIGKKSVTDVDVILKDRTNLHKAPYSGVYRNYRQIVDMINNSALSNNVKVLSRRIFDIKAKAGSEGT